METEVKIEVDPSGGTGVMNTLPSDVLQIMSPPQFDLCAKADQAINPSPFISVGRDECKEIKAG
jgi:hypothetical protein